MNANDNVLKLESWLPDFFLEYQNCRQQSKGYSPKIKLSWIKQQNLEEWFFSMEQPLLDARKGAFSCDPWDIAGIKREEVKNSAILAWLLNPKGSHGLGYSALNALLDKLNLELSNDFPKTSGSYCFVRAEANPDGDITNRIDIEIESENFYLLIEVKIDALEGVEQLERYGNLAESQASGRPWVILFLTIEKLKPNTAGKHIGKVFPMSWCELSRLLMTSVAPSLRQNNASKAASRIMSEQIVRCFINKIKSF